jgi:hypothetical protein
MDLGSIQPLTEISTWNLHGGKGRPAHKADNRIAICEATVKNVGALTSRFNKCRPLVGPDTLKFPQTTRIRTTKILQKRLSKT